MRKQRLAIKHDFAKKQSFAKRHGLVKKNRLELRGYTLIEIAIVVTVSIMMTYWLATSYYNVDHSQKNQDAKETMQIIKKAIVNYAVKSQTKSYSLYLEDAVKDKYWRVAHDRSYLPCPDITGDGIEDRQPLLTLSVLTVNIGTSIYPLETGGGCYRHRGLVPWKTLNTPRSDPWGNLYTYRVDNNFANAMVGFDANTESTDVYYTRPVTLDVDAATVTIIVQKTKPASDVNITRTSFGAGAVATVWNGINIIDQEAPNIVCNKAPCSRNHPATVSLVAGEALTVSTQWRVGQLDTSEPVYAKLAPKHIVDGLPFVIVSHGHNGYGAVGANAAGSVNEMQSMICRQVPSGNEDERQNAFWAEDLSVNKVISGVTLSFQCPEVKPTDSSASSNGFVARPHNYALSDDLEDFDDIVDWMSVENLKNEMLKRGRLPTQPLPPMGLEDE